jgi:hypothetical protein
VGWRDGPVTVLECIHGLRVARDCLVQPVAGGADPGTDAGLPGNVQGGFRVVQALGGVIDGGL